MKYCSKLKKPTERQALLEAYFVDREWMNLVKMNFIYAAIRELIEGIDFSETRTVLLHSRENGEDIKESDT